jgi:hypothetical protein
MMREALFIFFAQFFFSCAAPQKETIQTPAPPSVLSRWIVTEPPVENSDRWYAANYSHREWSVFMSQGRADVAPLNNTDDRAKFTFTPPKYFHGFVHASKVDDGWIVGLSEGEFGASVWWYSLDGEEHYKISDDQIQCFISSQKGLLALQGLSHKGYSHGSVIRFVFGADKKWYSETFVELTEAPDAGTLAPDGSLLVVTTQQLLKISLDKKIEVLLGQVFWAGLYPNSIVLDASAIYVGMRHGVAQIVQQDNGYRVFWLLPDQAAVDALPIDAVP